MLIIISSAARILNIVIAHLDDNVHLARLYTTLGEHKGEDMNGTDDALHSLDECMYYLRTISNVIRFSAENVWASSIVPSRVMSDVEKSIRHPSKVLSEDDGSELLIHHYLAEICMQILRNYRKSQDLWGRLSPLRQTAVELLQQLFVGSSTDDLLGMGLEDSFIDTISWAVECGDLMLQVLLIDLMSTVLSFQSRNGEKLLASHRTQSSMETVRSASQLSLSKEEGSIVQESTSSNMLTDCLILGVSSLASHSILDHWMAFVDTCLPLIFTNTFQALMPLVDCFIRTVELVFQRVQDLFQDSDTVLVGCEEPILIINSLLNGLEQVLAVGHDRLVQREGHTATITSPEQGQGFFGNMVSGVFSPEAQKSRLATANNRLIVLLCFKDAVRMSFILWLWGDRGSVSTSRELSFSASLAYTSLRLKNRVRRMLEHLLAVEALECLETLVEFWRDAIATNDIRKASTVINLLHALRGSRPKNTIPALFNAIYSRTNPQVLDPIRKSTLTSEISDTVLATFLTDYTRSMEDDALEEIWMDCMTFLRDVLGNPLPHRQTLPILLQFTAVLSEKIDNTNFGEQRKMRRDIGVSQRNS